MAPALSIVLAGGSGFLGTHLSDALRERGHQITTLTRSPADGPHQRQWDPAAGKVDRDLVGAADVVINLAGSPLIGNPHSKAWATALRESRISTTGVLAEAIAAAPTPPAYLAGNGIAYYGDHGDAVLSEAADTRGHALLTEVCREWEDAARPAAEAGSRVCVLRTSPVMDLRKPPLQWLRLLFKAGVGGRLGSGKQHMPMISLRDWVGGVVHLAEHDSVAGPVNFCLAQAPTNAEFTRALAKALHRPAFATVPSAVLRAAAGDLAPELLGSVNVVPRALEDSGYELRDPDVESMLATALAGG